jgi:hypothetical protein
MTSSEHLCFHALVACGTDGDGDVSVYQLLLRLHCSLARGPLEVVRQILDTDGREWIGESAPEVMSIGAGDPIYRTGGWIVYVADAAGNVRFDHEETLALRSGQHIT